ncbi:hypothetical protein OAE12_01235 [bacterium]|nr:hypothetical protein [bacterium]
MFSKYFTHHKLFQLFALVLFTCVFVRGQEIQNYKGPLKIGTFLGDASYSYKVVGEDTILDGNFRLKKANLDALLQKRDYSFEISGNFSRDYPNGFWKFEFGEFQTNKSSQVIDYQYRVAVNGIQEEASGILVKGKPDGTWNYTINRIEDSRISQNLFKSTISFNNGIPQKSFRIDNDSLTLAGRFLRNGLAHDEWSLFESFGLGASENWRFNNGLLQKIESNLDGSSTSTNIYNRYDGKTKTINLDKRYIEAITIYQFAKNNTNDSIGGAMQGLLAQNAKYYKKLDNILSELGKSDFLPEFKVKVPYFPFSEDEIQLLDSIESNYSAAKNISSAFLEDTQLNILKLSNEEAAFQYAVIKSISENFLQPTGKLLKYNIEKVAEFAPRKGLIENLWSKGKPDTTIPVVVELNDTKTKLSFSLEDSSSYNFSGADLKSVLEITKYAKESLFTINEELRQRLNIEKREQELITIEEQLVKEQKALHAFVESVQSNSPTTINKSLQKLKERVDAELSAYALMPNNSAKLVQGKELALCANQINTLSTTIADLPEKEKEIKQKYLDRIWNPFMANLMDEEVKKRIVSAYIKILVPYFLEKTKQDFNCSEAQDLNLLIENTYQRMLKLRDENTSKLERKLRRQTDPQVILGLFEVEPISIEK